MNKVLEQVRELIDEARNLLEDDEDSPDWMAEVREQLNIVDTILEEAE